MKFTTPCFIRCDTPEPWQRLEEMGYEVEHLQTIKYIAYEGVYYHEDNGYATTKSGTAYLTNVDGMRPTYIDCGTNEALFLALAALREDSDKFQWFTDETNYYWERCPDDKARISLFNDRYNVKTCHKATPDELIEHFKNNE